MYVLTNGSYYCNKTNTSKILKTQNIRSAAKYDTEEKAKNELIRASSKLKGFHIYKIEDINEPEETIKNACKKRIQFSTDMRKIVYRNSKGYCCLCGKFVDYDEFTIDHIIPLAKGGTNELDNLQCACKVCNNIKTDVLPNEFIDKITEMLIYSMKQKYNKEIGRKMFHMLVTSKLHRLGK